MQHVGANACPLIVGAYFDQRDELIDSLGSIQKTGFIEHFPQFRYLDLPGLIMQKQLAQAIIPLKQCEFFITTSYHVALLMKISGVPTFLFALTITTAKKRTDWRKVTPLCPVFSPPAVSLLLPSSNSMSLNREKSGLTGPNYFKRRSAGKIQLNNDTKIPDDISPEDGYKRHCW